MPKLNDAEYMHAIWCTPKEQETCDVEKRGCEGCYYENETPEKKIERLEIVKDMLDGELKLLRDELQQEKEKNKKLEKEIIELQMSQLPDTSETYKGLKNKLKE